MQIQFSPLRESLTFSPSSLRRKTNFSLALSKLQKRENLRVRTRAAPVTRGCDESRPPGVAFFFFLIIASRARAQQTERGWIIGARAECQVDGLGAGSERVKVFRSEVSQDPSWFD